MESADKPNIREKTTDRIAQVGTQCVERTHIGLQLGTNSSFLATNVEFRAIEVTDINFRF